MATIVSGKQKTIEEWEAYLRPQVNNVELLGEIPITQEESALLGQAIAPLKKLLGHRRSLRWLLEHAKSAFAVYLVAEGIHSYNGGDYWTKVLKATGWSSSYTSQIGQTFEESLEALHLPLFYDMRAEKAQRYVSLILAHGGIPTYCLPDFFTNMLQPAVLHAEYSSMTPSEMIDEWRWRAKAQLFTDKPVLRFLTYGGRVAEDFLDRCREMAQTYVETGDILPAEDLGLPTRVVTAYAEWVAAQGQEQIKREERDLWRLRKPEIRVDPWGEGILFDLPPQQVPATFIHAEMAWRITYAGRTTHVPVRVSRSGFDWVTVPESVRLSAPADAYQAEFLVDGATKRMWRFQGVDEDAPLFIFDAARLSTLAWKFSIPAQCLGFLYPRETQLTVEPSAPAVSDGDSGCSSGPRLLEVLPRLPGGWSNFQGQIWDVAAGDHVVLSQGDQQLLTVEVRADEITQRPSLVGGTLVYEDAAGRRAPVYVGLPPRLRIPITKRGTLEEELTRWRLSIQSNWAAAPEIDVTKTLKSLQAHIQLTDDKVELPLSLPELLGDCPVGNYTVRLRGPLGRSGDFKLRMLSHFVVCGHEALYVPESGSGQQPVELLIETASGDTLDCRGHRTSEGEDIACQDLLLEKTADTWEYALTVPPEVIEVEITVIHPRSRGDPVRVPVHVSIRRLRWAWIDEQQERFQFSWTGQAIRLPVEALLQAQFPALLIALPLQEVDNVQMALRLIDVDDQPLMIWNVPNPRGYYRVWRAELAAFLDTIRASASPALRMELLISGLLGQSGVKRWHVLTLTRTLSIQDVQVQCQVDADEVSVTLRWRETMRLSNRVVRFWSLWRPWQPVQVVNIPDNADGEMKFRLPSAKLAPGAYRLQFLTEDPWTTDTHPQRPAEGEPGTTDVALSIPVARLRWLEEEIAGSGNPFPLWLERAYIGHTIDDQRGGLEDLEHCYENLDGGSIPQILALHDLMVEMVGEGQLKALELKMFAAMRIKRLLDAYAQMQVSPEHFDAYLACLPRSGLLPQATCELLLSIDHERAQIYALRQLMQRGSPLGPKTLHRWVQQARISDADAVAMLNMNIELSVAYLQDHWEDSTARRLLSKVSRASGDPTRVIKAGFWVRTDVGWGRINRIVDIDEQPVEDMFRGDSAHHLYVTLRPDEEPETIVVDLTKMRVTFTEPGTIYTCTCEGCEGCSSHSDYVIRESHNRAAHHGLAPAFRKERFSFRTTRTLRYSARRPRNQLA
ncbi:MAG: hypothetical protein JXC32_08460 [Anaerolineae bacterium]|nr:hypothetical protein [Anaerolineae bacterium]